MGKNNRHPPPPPPPDDADWRPALDRLLVVVHTSDRLAHELDLLLDGLAADQRAEGDRVIEHVIAARLGAAWERGWQPVDVVEISQRKLTDEHQLFAISAVVELAARAGGDDSTPPLDWLQQIDELRVDLPRPVESTGPQPELLGMVSSRRRAWQLAIEWVHLLRSLGPIPEVGPVPSAWGTVGAPLADISFEHLDDKVLVKVRGLLAKAESTTFPDEAESLTAKAQELMSRHAIDQALVDEQGRADPAGGPLPRRRRLRISDPYVTPKALLVSQIAEANRCRAVFTDLGFMTLVGFRADLEAVVLLYTSLLVQATTGILAAGPQRDRSGRSTTRSFRSSFWVAYAQRIGERLVEAAGSAVDEAQATHGDALLPVLASRQARVDAELERAFPHVRSVSTKATNAAGWQAGRAAADRADLGTRRAVDDRSRRL